jgi:hypothetical protein
MTANRSSAVMQQRIEPPDSLDYFPTQPWAVRAACEFIRDELGEPLGQRSCWEPACGEGFMARPLAEYFGQVIASDVHLYNDDHGLVDFLQPIDGGVRADWIITNPPFRLAARFVELARARASRGVAMFVRSAFTEGGERRETIFAPDRRPSHVVTYSERVALLKGRLIRIGHPDPFNLDDHARPVPASTATSYSLLVWRPGQHDTRHRWIGKCRARLERDEDYPAYEAQWAEVRRLQAELAAAGGQEKLI